MTGSEIPNPEHRGRRSVRTSHGRRGAARGSTPTPCLLAFLEQRTDRYGGSFENRAHFARDILASVRRRIGGKAIVGYRMGVEEFTPGGVTIEDAKSLAALLAGDGAGR
jgi:NADH:flavin oxidoreductase / NADH oxidase family